MMCRLRTNLIVNGQFIARDSVIDDELVPERLKGEAYIAYDLEGRDDGKVLVLHDISFESVPRPGADGIPVSYPVQ